MSTIWADLPRAGLGNKLLVWAEALVLEQRFQASLITTNWDHFSIGPWLRGEYNKRQYNGQFHNDVWFKRWALRFKRNAAFPVPSAQILRVEANASPLYRVHEIPHWDNYFKNLTAQRVLIVDRLQKLLLPSVKQELADFPTELGAVHIRLGDFKKLAANTDFKSVGHTRTPTQYFAQRIRNIRQALGFEFPFLLYSDGHDHELAELLTMPGIKRAPAASDIVHILAMSKARVLLPSAGSTFSLWSAFLSDSAITLHHPDHYRFSVRPIAAELPFEGAPNEDLSTWPRELVDQLQKITKPSL